MGAFYSTPDAEHRAVREAAGLFGLPFRSMFTAKGADRARFLHNMVTNDVKGLAPGHGAYAMMLDVRGHILADLNILCDAEQFVLETSRDLVEKVLSTLGRYNIGGRVPIDETKLDAVSVQGPSAETILRDVLRIDLPGPEELRHLCATYGGESVRIIRLGITGETGFEIWAQAEASQSLRKDLLGAGCGSGLVPCGAAALEMLRIEAGIPAYGSELAEDTLPLEANLSNALSFTKGCYIGQEIVERMRSRGHANWKLVGLFVNASQPPGVGEQLLREGKSVGEITSACVSPSLGRTIAMAYVRREAADIGNELTLPSGATVEITALPFYRRPA